MMLNHFHYIRMNHRLDRNNIVQEQKHGRDDKFLRHAIAFTTRNNMRIITWVQIFTILNRKYSYIIIIIFPVLTEKYSVLQLSTELLRVIDIHMSIFTDFLYIHRISYSYLHIFPKLFIYKKKKKISTEFRLSHPSIFTDLHYMRDISKKHMAAKKKSRAKKLMHAKKQVVLSTERRTYQNDEHWTNTRIGLPLHRVRMLTENLSY